MDHAYRGHTAEKRPYGREGCPRFIFIHAMSKKWQMHKVVLRFRDITVACKKFTGNSPGDEIANVNVLYDDIVQH